MTQEQDIELRNFEARVRQLMLAYQEERKRNAELQEELATCQQQLADTQKEVEQAKPVSYTHLTLPTILLV